MVHHKVIIIFSYGKPYVNNFRKEIARGYAYADKKGENGIVG